jgi:hypothetical protein
MATSYYYHADKPDVRIKVTAKTVTWERLQTVNLDEAISGAPEQKEWRYYMRHPLPVNNAEILRTMYNLPDEVVAKLKG